MKSLKGHLLISSGGLYDPNFRHTVVLIGEHNADGALGVVLNRTLDATVGETFPMLSGFVDAEALLHQGGPVEPESGVLLAELDRPGLADLSVLGTVGFLIGEIEDEMKRHIVRARLFAGYSGWAPLQLETELAEKSWIVDAARIEDIFTDDPEGLWSKVLIRKGPQYAFLSRMPFDPSMN